MSGFAGDIGLANRMLLALPPYERNRLMPSLKLVELERGQIICRLGEKIRQFYFVNRGIVSLVHIMRDGRTVEIGTTGIEGLTTPEGAFGIDTAIFQNMVQVPGSAFVIDKAVLRDAMGTCHILGALFQGYVCAAAHQIGQTAACNRLHSLDERLCRWLLTAHDSARSDTFSLTHEFLAMMLGVQRAGVSVSAMNLQKAGFISYRHGLVTIIDRAGIEASACECYGVIREQFDRLFGRAMSFA